MVMRIVVFSKWSKLGFVEILVKVKQSVFKCFYDRNLMLSPITPIATTQKITVDI